MARRLFDTTGSNAGMSMPEPTSEERHRLLEQVELLRSSDIFGKSSSLRRIFEYLVRQAIEGRTPTEFEVALDALGKDDKFDASQDATVRAYIHRLRKRLEEFYAGQPLGSARLVLPRGSYQLILRESPAAEPAIPSADERDAGANHSIGREAKGQKIVRYAACAALGILAGVGVFWVVARYQGSGETTPTGIWAPFADGSAPNILVVGNEASDDGQSRVVSLGAAVALLKLSPVALSSLQDRHGLTLTGSIHLSPRAIRDSNIIYIGLFKQMGLLADFVFAGSKISMDRTTALVGTMPAKASDNPARSKSQGAGAVTSYGYIASRRGSAKTHLVVIAGVTDGALAQTAEVAADTTFVKGLTTRYGQTFEALLAVKTINNINVSHRVVFARSISSAYLTP